MMSSWFIVIGAVLVMMAVLGTLVDKLPLSSALIYLAIGFVLGPAVSGLLRIDPVRDSAVLEVVFLVAVLVSLFTIGLKLRTPTEMFSRRLWTVPILLAGPAMIVTITLVALVGVYVLHLPWGAAILLGAVLAPTDPVLASDIQVRHENDRDDARFALSAEGGLNDATASPFVWLGLGLLGLHELGDFGWRWFTVDVLWASIAGFGVGWLCGLGTGVLVLAMRKHFKHAYGLEEFLGLGLIALSYGLADALHGIGFIAVLAAGLAMRRIESRDLEEKSVVVVEDKPLTESADKADLPREAPTHMLGQVLDFNQRFESIGEVASVLVVGALLSAGHWSWEGLGVAIALFVVIRPVSVYLSTGGSRADARHKRMMAWFGIRGVGTLYYLMFVVNHDLQQPWIDRIVPIALTVVAASIVVHGISATPLMDRYERAKRRGRRRRVVQDDPAR